MKLAQKTSFRVEFDDDVMSLIMSAAAEGRLAPAKLIESIVKEVMFDDRATECGASRRELLRPN